MKQFNALNYFVQQIIINCVSDACGFVNDMMNEPICQDSPKPTTQAIKDQSYDMMQVALDPDNADIVLPASLQAAIDEYVDAKVGFAIIN